MIMQYQNWSSAHPNEASHIVLQGAINTSTSQFHIAYRKIKLHNEYQHQILNIKIEYQKEIINVNVIIEYQDKIINANIKY